MNISKEIAELLFACIMLSPFIGAGCYGIFCWLRGVYRHIYCRRIAPNQHLMLCQLSKGDAVWVVYPGEKPECYYVENVKYKYDKDNVLTYLTICLAGSYNFEVEASKAKAFSYEIDNYYRKCKCYTLMGEAMAAYDLCMSKRNSEIKKIKTVSPDEIKSVADKTIKELEDLKKKCL